MQRRWPQDATGASDRHPQASSCLAPAEVPPRPWKPWPIDPETINLTVASQLPKDTPFPRMQPTQENQDGDQQKPVEALTPMLTADVNAAAANG